MVNHRQKTVNTIILIFLLLFTVSLTSIAHAQETEIDSIVEMITDGTETFSHAVADLSESQISELFEEFATSTNEAFIQNFSRGLLDDPALKDLISSNTGLTEGELSSATTTELQQLAEGDSFRQSAAKLIKAREKDISAFGGFKAPQLTFSMKDVPEMYKTSYEKYIDGDLTLDEFYEKIDSIHDAFVAKVQARLKVMRSFLLKHGLSKTSDIDTLTTLNEKLASVVTAVSQEASWLDELKTFNPQFAERLSGENKQLFDQSTLTIEQVDDAIERSNEGVFASLGKLQKGTQAYTDELNALKNQLGEINTNFGRLVAFKDMPAAVKAADEGVVVQADGLNLVLKKNGIASIYQRELATYKEKVAAGKAKMVGQRPIFSPYIDPMRSILQKAVYNDDRDGWPAFNSTVYGRMIPLDPANRDEVPNYFLEYIKQLKTAGESDAKISELEQIYSKYLAHQTEVDAAMKTYGNAYDSIKSAGDVISNYERLLSDKATILDGKSGVYASYIVSNKQDIAAVLETLSPADQVALKSYLLAVYRYTLNDKQFFTDQLQAINDDKATLTDELKELSAPTGDEKVAQQIKNDEYQLNQLADKSKKYTNKLYDASTNAEKMAKFLETLGISTESPAEIFAEKTNPTATSLAVDLLVPEPGYRRYFRFYQRSPEESMVD